MATAPRIGLVSGFWGQNIGNAFFNIGGKYLLDSVCGPNQVQFVQDQPAYRTLYNQRRGAPKNYAKIHERLDIDLLVLQGPMLTRNFAHIWSDTFKALKRQGTRIALISAGLFSYDAAEIHTVRDFLRCADVDIIATRDRRTFEHISDLAPRVYDGIDSAFFVSDAFKPLSFRTSHMAFNFDRYPEPDLIEGAAPVERTENGFEFESNYYQFTHPRLTRWLAERGPAVAYLGHLFDHRALPEKFAGRTILRPEHRYSPHMTHKVYQHPNAFVSDEPFTYLSAYANSDLTLSDRVHACVATLAFGRPAMLFAPTPRAALFERIGLATITQEPVSVSADYLQDQKQAYKDWLKEAVLS